MFSTTSAWATSGLERSANRIGPFRRLKHRAPSLSSFTLVEVLVAMAIFIILLGIIFAIINQVANVVRQSTRQIEAFQSARLGYDLMTHTLGPGPRSIPTWITITAPIRPTTCANPISISVIGPAGAPALKFPGTPQSGQAVFFQAPIDYVTNVTGAANLSGFESLLNTVGYYVSFTTNSGIPSYIKNASNPFRYRLMQMLVPAENNEIYNVADTVTNNGWFTDPALQSYVMPVADNIIALIVRPQDPSTNPPTDLTPDYTYDSNTNWTGATQPAISKQLPPVLQITMIAIDEASSKRLDTGGSTPPSAISSALSGKFQTSASYTTDLAQLEQQLTSAHIL